MMNEMNKETIRYKDLAHAELNIGMTLAIAKRKLKEFKDKYNTKDILYKIQRREVKDLERVQDTLLRTIEILRANELYHHDS